MVGIQAVRIAPPRICEKALGLGMGGEIPTIPVDEARHGVNGRIWAGIGTLLPGLITFRSGLI